MSQHDRVQAVDLQQPMPDQVFELLVLGSDNIVVVLKQDNPFERAPPKVAEVRLKSREAVRDRGPWEDRGRVSGTSIVQLRCSIRGLQLFTHGAVPSALVGSALNIAAAAARVTMSIWRRVSVNA